MNIGDIHAGANGRFGGRTVLRALIFCIELVASCAAADGHAQIVEDSGANGAGVESPAPAATPAPPGADSSESATLDKFARFDALGEPGLTTNLPGFYDTITGDAGGWRSALAAHDAALQIFVPTVLMYNPFDTGQPRSPQRYNGQRFTVQAQSVAATLTIGLGAIGLPNSKFIISGESFLSSASSVNGPSVVAFRELAYYQSFADKMVELKLGWLTNFYEYVGLFTAGNPVLSSGLAGLIPIAVGLSANPDPAPAVNITLHGADGLYAKFGVQRSISPQGRTYETNNFNVGLKFSQPGAGPLYIGEVGILKPPTANNHQIWLRAGLIYNDSDFTRFTGGGTANNRAAYVAGDYQITQLSQALSFRGLYAGAAVYLAPSDVNVYTQTYDLRLYTLGLFDARPTDAMTLEFTYNKFSRDAINATEMQGGVANPNQFSAQVSYAVHVSRGIYIIPAVSFLRHPSFLGNFRNAVVFTTSFNVLL